MEVIDSSKYVGVVSLFLFLLSCTLFKAANAQPEGFVSIDCGGERNRTDLDTNITWVTDDHYLHNNLGVKAESYYNYALRHFYLGSLLVFPKPVKKACYELPLTPNVPHLLRVSFVDANSTGSRGFNYSIETSDMLYMENVIPYYCLVCRSEHILVSTDKVVHICLIRTSECDDPFISAIELRPLQKGMYKRAKPGTMLNLIERDDMGDAYEVTRYPQDKFDRRWIPWLPDGTCSVNASDRVSVSSNTNFPPLNVMQTAVVSNTSNSNRIYFTLGTYDTGNSILLLYFANLNLTETNLFSVGINNAIQNQSIPLKDFSALELEFEFNGTRGATMILESNTPNQSPIINAVEIYSLVLTKPATSLDDVKAIIEVWKAFYLKNWTRDPCFGLPWEGIICSNINNTARISQIDLSGKQLRGPIPPTFGQLTELVSLNLQHNNLTGPLPEWISKLSRLKELILNNNYFNGSLPNLSDLTKLKTLHLQNNYLSDKLPDWLSKLPCLKELNIANNNFKGVIPQELQHLKQINFTFDGNKHLCRTNKECRDHPRSTLVVWLGVGGALILTAILVGIIMYRMKLKSACTQPSPLDYLMVNVACSSKSRAFTIDEMKMATENFTHKIGQGSFGTVFLGELQDGKQIAVKVLSLFSKHGIEQFLNEVELLSRINHKKLVSFLGYCNESRDLMLVYEYMSGGSLSDNLYDPEAPKYSQLDWKTRLKIALDAAQGLEYLHVGCTPKIIHRDVKTSNILLDSNLNGKLADFGLSRVTGNGETSQINTTIKGTPGYLDPMYYKTHMLTDKSDVYSFGVVLLELICGRKPIDLKVSAEKIFLTEWVASIYDGVDKDDACNIEEIVDKRLGKRYNMESIIRLTNLGRRCIASEPSGRPAISEVVAEIKESVKYAEEYYQVPDEVSLTFTSTSSASL